MAQDIQGPWALRYRGFMIIFRTTIFRRTPLDERSVRRRESYLITHNNHKWKASSLLAGFEPTITLSELPHTHALEGRVTGTG